MMCRCAAMPEMEKLLSRARAVAKYQRQKTLKTSAKSTRSSPKVEKLIIDPEKSTAKLSICEKTGAQLFAFSVPKNSFGKKRGLDSASPLDKVFSFHHGFDCSKLLFQVTVYTQ